MGFSLKPGVAYYALTTATMIVIAMMAAVVTKIIYDGSSGDEDAGQLAHLGFEWLVAVSLGSMVTAFLVSDFLMPPLCRWIEA